MNKNKAKTSRRGGWLLRSAGVTAIVLAGLAISADHLAEYETIEGFDSIDTYRDGELAKSCMIDDPADCWVRTWTGRWSRPDQTSIWHEARQYWVHRALVNTMSAKADG